jgi:APA family basic amino acid/polyamine antiporter
MAQSMGATWILLDWLLGMVLAMSGARAYAEVARMVPRSGGEYRYLSDLVHPMLGYVAGWGSMLAGFSAPIAINALGTAAFLGTIIPIAYPRVVATGFILALSASHGIDLVASKWTQNLLIFLKVALLVGFVAMGLVLGENRWPTWTPPHGSPDFDPGPFFGGIFWIAFAFSGWSAAAYAAGEFRHPTRDVPRAMLIGCAAVGVLYLLVNWVFVANLSPADASVVFEDRPVTLAHAVAAKLIGPTTAGAVSVFVALAFISAMSAMILVGPRVYSAMAADGFLPRALAARAGRPPIGSVLFQAAVSIAIVWTHTLRSALETVGALLVLFTALTAAALFATLHRRDLPRPRPLALASATVYVALSGWILYEGVRYHISGRLLLWTGILTAAAAAGYVATARAARRG